MSKNKRRSVEVAEPEIADKDLENLENPTEEAVEQEEDSPAEDEAEENLSDPAPKENPGERIVRFLSGLPADKIRCIGGILFLFLGFLLFISLLSHFFFWWKDYDVVQQMQGNPWTGGYKPLHNLCSSLGAFVSFAMVNKGFGIASFIFPFVLIKAGLQTLRIKKFRWLKIFFRDIFLLLWISTLTGFVFKSGMFTIMGGSVGLFISRYLCELVGLIGLVCILLFTLLCYLILNYNLSKLRFGIRKPKPETENETENARPASDQRDEEAESEEENEEESEEDPLDHITLSTRIGLNTPAVQDTPGEDHGSEPSEEDEDKEEDIAQDYPEKDANDGEDADEEADALGEMKIIDTRATSENDKSDKDLKAIRNGEHIGIDTPYDPKLELSDYRFPSLDLLEDFGDQSRKVQDMNEELQSNKDLIVKTLRNYGIEIIKIFATIGPTVTLYEIVPAPGIRISKIKNLEDDIALSLSALGIRIIAPIPGKGTIGIEVPNSKKQIVPMRDMLTCNKFLKNEFALPIAIGKTISNEEFVADLAKMPHLLVAGATGQGKSVGLNAIIASLLYCKHPAELKFVMVDPKKVELSLFNKIERHYLAKLPDSEEAIITDTRKVVRTLNSLCIEMDTRYDLLKDAGAKNIKEYNKKFITRKLNPQEGHRFLPYIVLIIDEFADLIMTAGKEIEQPIARLAQLARAIGIHLVIATQRPTVNIITGTIKANFPARMAFKVMQKNDSRTILDANGADQLIGRGDMLISAGEGLIRLQCAFIDTPEIERITDFIGSQRGYPDAYLLPECPDESESAKADIGEEEWDSMFRDAAELVVSTQQGSTSMLQRKFKLGYNRAGRIMDQLENAGIVGPFDGKKTRDVKIKDPMALEQVFNSIGV